MRIRTIKPEFWRSPDVTALSPRVCFSGPIKTGVRNPWAHLPRWGELCGYVYVFSDGSGKAVYVGKTMTPQYRIPKHQRKSWWGQVSHVTLFEVHGGTQKEAEANHAALEAIMIERLVPPGNIARPCEKVREAIHRKEVGWWRG